ncbi:hypothetical protein JL721_8101 [Aureococcus anophagefferens]|nr:hypothetical protein JL721_8101 [Aureococcus anophagefferens]
MRTASSSGSGRSGATTRAAPTAASPSRARRATGAAASRGAFAERVLRIAFATRRSPAAALEIGPCNNPTPLPPDIVQRVDFVDVPEYYEAPNCARFDANDTEIPYRPRYLDDAQALAKARDRRFKLAVPMLVASGERTLMDRYRLAHPGSHHVRDFWNRAPELVKPPPEHAMEMALSTYRLLELLHILKEPSLAGTGALEEVRGRLALPAATTWDELRSMRLHLIGHKDREGHVHVWSRRTLKDMLRAAERLLAAVALVAETAASQPAGARRFQEYRAVLAKGAGDAADVFRDLFAKRWCLRANASYVRAARHASPILLGDIDVDEPDPAFRGSTPVVCTHLVRAVRTWARVAPAATADRRTAPPRRGAHGLPRRADAPAPGGGMSAC